MTAQDKQNPSSSSATLSVTEGEEKEPSAWRKERSFSRPSLFDRIRMALKYPSEWSIKKDSFTLISNLPEWACDILIRQLSQTTPIPLRPPGYFNDCYDRSAAEESNRLAYGRIGGSVCANCPVDAGPCPICGTIWERRGIERIGRLVVPRQAPSVGPGNENQKTAQDKPKPVSALSVTEAHPKEEKPFADWQDDPEKVRAHAEFTADVSAARGKEVKLSDQNELLPCPHCGRTPTFVRETPTAYWQVVCLGCDQSGLTKDEAAAAWNKRAEISVSEDTKRLDRLESLCFTNREGEREIHFDFRGTLREAIDGTVARNDVDRRDSSGVREEA